MITARRVTVIVTMIVAVVMSMAVVLGCVLRGPVPTEMVVVMAMRRRSDDWLRYPTFFTKFRRRRSLIVVFRAASHFVSNEPFERRLVHVTGKRNLRVFHAQRAWVRGMLRYLWGVVFVSTIPPRSNGEC
jgi:hypothetical protein